MKKTKLLFAAPIMLAPAIAAIPSLSSCHKNGPINVSSELSKYVDMDTIVDGDSYYILMNVKEDQVGKQYLPTYLTSVKSGDVELEPFDAVSNASNDIVDYYSYETYNNNSSAVLFVRMFRGSITIEGATATLKSVTATGIDLTGRTIAEFEDGETFDYDTTRVLALANLSNGQSFILEDNYTIDLKNSKFVKGYKFTYQDKTTSDKKGTVTFNGITSNEFDYRVIESTVAVLTCEPTSKEGSIEKYAHYDELMTAYDAITDAGYYTISLVGSWTNSVNATKLTLTQKAGKHLTLNSIFGTATLVGKFEADKDSAITINAEANSTDSSITISNIYFENPETSLTGKTYSSIYLGAGSPHDIYVEDCYFEGDSEFKNSIEAVYSDYQEAATSIPSYISIIGCIGENLNSLFRGLVAHGTTSSLYDFYMSGCELNNSKELFRIAGDQLSACIVGCSAELLFSQELGETEFGGITICGNGTYSFNLCKFTQLEELTPTTNGFVRIETLGAYGVSAAAKQLIFNYCSLNKLDGATNLHVVNNATSSATDHDWNITWTDLLLTGQEGKVWGVESGSNKTYWDPVYPQI